MSRAGISACCWTFLVACSTGPSVVSSDPGPAGFIYFGGDPAAGQPLERIGLRTGLVEPVAWPSALPDGQTFLSRAGMVSAIDGRIAAQGIVGQGWPRTFVLDPATAQVHVYADPVVTRDFGHTWSPDGQVVVFERHLATGGDGRTRIVRLDVATGITDTIATLETHESVDGMIWLGTDSLVLDDFLVSRGSGYEVLALESGARSEFSEVVHPGWGPALAFSPTGRWLSHWSMESGAGGADSLVLSLRDRRTGQATERLQAVGFFETDGSLDVAFSPDGDYLADCVDGGLLRVVRLPSLQPVRTWPIPKCGALSWSWGPEGRPPDLGG